MTSAVPPTTSELIGSLATSAGLSSRFRRFAPVTREGLAAHLGEMPLLMAPMAGVSNAAYRIMARAGGAGAAYSEMVSVAGIHYASQKTWELVDPDPAEPDLCIQLFGSKPEQFREATAAVCERLADRLALIDINMACPVPKVTRKGEGSALLDDPLLAAKIVDASLLESCVPVTCKIRIGRVPNRIVGPDFARAMEQAGAAAIAVHGRSASQLYRGEADWDQVRCVVDAVDIPVIGSGDVLSAEAAVRMLRETGAAAVFLARGTYGNPWVFGDAACMLAGKEAPEHPLSERLAAFELHVRLLDATLAHMVVARQLACWYFKGLPGASELRSRAMACSTTEEFLQMIDDVRHETA